MMRKIFLRGFVAGLKHSFIFIFFSFLLTRPVSWCRTLGGISAAGWSFYLASSQKFLSWQNSLNVLFNLCYLTFSQKKQAPLPSLEEYLNRDRSLY